MGEFRHLGDRVIHTGHVITVVEAAFSSPDGETFHRDVVRHPGAVSVVAVHDDGRVVLVRQYRAALDAQLLEIPAGKRDVADEPLETTARRELIEEVGLDAERFEHLVCFHNSVGFCDEESHIFIATGLSSAPMDRQGIEESYLEIVEVPLAETPAMIASGEITDAKTVIGLSLAAARL